MKDLICKTKKCSWMNITFLEGILLSLLIFSVAITVDIFTEKYYLTHAKPLESIEIEVSESHGKRGFGLIQATGSFYQSVPCAIYAATLTIKNIDTNHITVIPLDHIHINLSIFDFSDDRTPVDLSVHTPKDLVPGIYTMTLDAIYNCSYGMLTDRKHHKYTSNEFTVK
jgi:hypothetical protein